MTSIILKKESSWIITSRIREVKRLSNRGYSIIAKTETKEQAAQLVLGLRSSELVDTFLSHLPNRAKVLVKTEIASIATDYHNNF